MYCSTGDSLFMWDVAAKSWKIMSVMYRELIVNSRACSELEINDLDMNDLEINELEPTRLAHTDWGIRILITWPSHIDINLNCIIVHNENNIGWWGEWWDGKGRKGL